MNGRTYLRPTARGPASRVIARLALCGIVGGCLAAGRADADDHGVVPAARHPAELDAPYSPDDPPGPVFPDAEKERQRTEGQRIRRDIAAALAAGRDSYAIPPGNYRFSANHREVTGNAFALSGLHGNPDRPFRIRGQGATLWFDLSDKPAPAAHMFVKIVDCSHITFEDVIVDSDPRSAMEARVTDFDFKENRIRIQPLAGTRLISQPPKAEGRFVPFKANGHAMPALYRIDQGWGPGNMFYTAIQRDPDGRYWLTMKNDKLLGTVRNDAWRDTYGSAGTLEVGDLLAVLWSTSVAISLENCSHVTVRNCRFYAAKSCLSESGGVGAHTWIGCRFTSRPGSNNLLGGEGTMNNACVNGSTFDGVIIRRTTDDAFNNHGYWHDAETVAAGGITYARKLPPLLAEGDKADLFDKKLRQFAAQLTVASVEGQTVRFKEPVDARFAGSTTIFPKFQNAGWVIRNCTFADCYQRILLQCGPGLFENNRIERVGSSLDLASGPVGHIEGGIPDGVTIRGNVFVDSSICPPNPVISLLGVGRPLRNARIEDNVILNAGREAFRVENADGLVLRGNVVLHPFKGSRLLPDPKATELPGIRLRNVRNADVCSNVVVRAVPGAGGLKDVLSADDACADVRAVDNRAAGDQERRVETLLRELTSNRERGAREMVDRIKAEIGNRGSNGRND